MALLALLLFLAYSLRICNNCLWTFNIHLLIHFNKCTTAILLPGDDGGNKGWF